MILARITTFDDLRLALNARKIALGLRNLDVDEICGFQGGYASKLFCGDKRPGDMSLPAILTGLGVELALVPTPPRHDDIALRPQSEMEARAKKIAQENGRKGGKRSMLLMLEEERRAHQSRAARARWKAWRQTNRTKQQRAVKAKRKAQERAVAGADAAAE